jgi:hypothetical protein
MCGWTPDDDSDNIKNDVVLFFSLDDKSNIKKRQIWRVFGVKKRTEDKD